MKRFFVGLLLLIPLLAACGGENKRAEIPAVNGVYRSQTETVEAASTEEETVSSDEPALTGETIYILTGIDTANGALSFRRVPDGMEGVAYYNGATFFYDKYGTIISLANFQPGDAVTLKQAQAGVLAAMQMSDEVFILRDVTDYNLDLDRMVFTVDGTNYRVTNNTPVYARGKDEGIYNIQEGDSLEVTGLGKDILSFNVTTGLGKIALKNIGVFKDGWLNLDNETYLQITDNVDLPAEEGTHTLTVANDGWGDSTVVTVKRGETVTVDLDSLKGEGPKYCDLTVIPDVEDAVVRMDGKRIPANESNSVRYGQHVLSVSAEGYDTWQSRLVVNSKEAEIEVDLKGGRSSGGNSSGGSSGDTVSPAATASSGTGTSAGTDDDEEVTAHEIPAEEGAAGSLAGSLANSGGAGASATRREAEQTAAESMLNTMTGLLDTLTGTGTSSTE